MSQIELYRNITFDLLNIVIISKIFLNRVITKVIIQLEKQEST